MKSGTRCRVLRLGGYLDARAVRRCDDGLIIAVARHSWTRNQYPVDLASGGHFVDRPLTPERNGNMIPSACFPIFAGINPRSGHELDFGTCVGKLDEARNETFSALAMIGLPNLGIEIRLPECNLSVEVGRPNSYVGNMQFVSFQIRNDERFRSNTAQAQRLHRLEGTRFPDRAFRVRRLSFVYHQGKSKIAKYVRLLRGVIADRLGHLSMWSGDEAASGLPA